MSEDAPRVALGVVFDSSVVHSTNPDEFSSSDLKRFIRALPDELQVRLFVPDVVRHERRFRMLTDLSRIAASIKPLVRSLSLNVDVGQHAIENAVDFAIEGAYRDLHLEGFTPDLARTKWENVVSDAVYRRPPFEAKGEKGFRDQVVIETARQIAEEFPENDLALVTRDKAMAEGARRQLAGLPRARIFEDLDAVADLAAAIAVGIPFDEHNQERLASMVAFFGRPGSHFHTQEQVLAVLKDRYPRAFERPASFDESSSPMVRVAPPILLGSAMGKRGWRTPVTVIHDGRVLESSLLGAESLTAPDGVATTVEEASSDPDAESGMGTVAMRVTDVFDIEWLGNALGRTAPGKADVRGIDLVTHVKRTIQIKGG